MRVAIWADTLGAAAATGTQTFLREVLTRLVATPSLGLELTLWHSASADPALPTRLRAIFPEDSVRIVGVPFTQKHLYRAGVYDQRVNISRYVGAQDLFLSGSHWPLGRLDRPAATIIYDLAPLEYRSSSSWWKDRLFRLVFRRAVSVSCGSADAIVAISNFTAAELSRRFSISPDRIRVIPLGCDFRGWERRIPDAEWQRLVGSLAVRSPYFLTAGSQVPRKNLPVLVRAFATLAARRPNTRLVLAGGTNTQTPLLRRMVEEHRLEGRVILPGSVSQAQLIALMQRAHAFVFPSLCEGFGLPVLEAMAAGIPVACSNATSLPEVVGEAALTFDPRSDADVARSLEILVSDEERRQLLIERGRLRVREFSWDAAAAGYEKLFAEFCA